MLDLLREVRPPFSPESVVAEFCETLAAYKVKLVQGDRFRPNGRASNSVSAVSLTLRPTSRHQQLFLEMLPLITAPWACSTIAG